MHFCPRTRHTRTPRKLKKRLAKKGLLWQVDRLAQNSLNAMRRRHEALLRVVLDAICETPPQYMTGTSVIEMRDYPAEFIILGNMPLAE